MKLFDEPLTIDEKIVFNELENGLVEAIEKWYMRNELHIVIIEGYQGVGKSLYSLLVASQVYNTKCWGLLKKYYVYDRQEFLTIVKNKRKRSPLLVWDDAGNWLHAQDYQKEDVVKVCRYFLVARPHWSCIMLTTPDAEDIVNRIRSMKERILIQIVRHSGKKDHIDRRKARIFVRWKSPDKTRKGEELQIEETFYLHDCDRDLYNNYEEYRNSFVDEARSQL